jgi:hypothetical protein
LSSVVIHVKILLQICAYGTQHSYQCQPSYCMSVHQIFLD